MLYKKSKFWFHTENEFVLFYKVVNKKVYCLGTAWVSSRLSLEEFEDNIKLGIIVPVI